MQSYSNIFSEIIVNNNIKNEFIGFFDAQANKLKNEFMPTEVVLNATEIAILKPEVAILQATVSTLDGDLTNLHQQVDSLQTDLTGVQGSISTLDTKVNNWSNIPAVSDVHFGFNQLHGDETYGLIMGTHLGMHYKDILDCGTLHTSNIKSALGLLTINSNVTLQNNALTCGTINSSTITSLQDQISAIPPADLSTWAANVASEDVKLGSRKLDFGAGTVKLEAQGSQLTTLGSFYADKSISCREDLSCDRNAYLGYDQLVNKATVFVDRANKLLTSEFDGEVSLTKFKDITISGTLTADTLKYTTLDPAIPQAVQYSQTLYVDANGKDSNAGNAAFPLKTISKAVQMACDGYVADGNHKTGSTCWFIAI
jgi:hypothetical protein